MLASPADLYDMVNMHAPAAGVEGLAAIAAGESVPFNKVGHNGGSILHRGVARGAGLSGASPVWHVRFPAACQNDPLADASVGHDPTDQSTLTQARGVFHTLMVYRKWPGVNADTVSGGLLRSDRVPLAHRQGLSARFARIGAVAWCRSARWEETAGLILRVRCRRGYGKVHPPLPSPAVASKFHLAPGGRGRMGRKADGSPQEATGRG